MSRLAIYNEQGTRLGDVLTEHKLIAAQLQPLGVRFERWQSSQTFSKGAQQEEVLAVYGEQVRRLSNEYGFQSMDVVSVQPDNPKRDELRAKFLAEHMHSDFEVRFFVAGAGLFYLHVADKVYLVLCEQGDLISVPANVRHWFDMGKIPDFKCIRLFVIADGWVAQFTGSDIAQLFPDFDEFVGQA
ncbi:MAG TPA: acireductone dioxygenase [Gammaproteobacteria bacterium]